MVKMNSDPILVAAPDQSKYYLSVLLCAEPGWKLQFHSQSNFVSLRIFFIVVILLRPVVNLLKG
jgi:hypothetical protein